MERIASSTKLDQAVAFIIRRTSRRLRVQLNRLLISNGFEGGSEQWLILLRLKQTGSLSQKELKDDNLDDRANISRQIKALLSSGYVDIQTDPVDARKKNISLTPKGNNKVAGIMPAIVAERKRLFSQFTNKELDTLVTLLEKLENSLS